MDLELMSTVLMRSNRETGFRESVRISSNTTISAGFPHAAYRRISSNVAYPASPSENYRISSNVA